MERKFGNVGILDLRDTDEQVFQDDLQFGNIGVVLFSKKTAPFLKFIKSGNIGNSVECDDEVQLIQGKSVLGSEALGNIRVPLRLLVVGKLVVLDDLSPEAFDRGVKSIQVSGKVVCPSDLLPYVQAKATNQSGNIETYPSGFKLYERSLHIDRSRLLALPPQSKIAVLADVTIDKDVPEALLKERLAGIYTNGNLVVPEHLVGTLSAALHPNGGASLSVVPDGYEVVADDIQVEPSDLELWQGAKILFSHSVRFSNDVRAEDIGKLERFIAKEEVYCRESLLPTLAKKCDRFKTKFVAFKDQLFFNEGQAELSSSFLTAANLVTIVNHGVLALDDSVTPELVSSKVDRIINTGVLMVNENAIGAVHAKAKDSCGPVIASSNDDEPSGVGNVGILKL